jgi:hypothetical protein
MEYEEAGAKLALTRQEKILGRQEKALNRQERVDNYIMNVAKEADKIGKNYSKLSKASDIARQPIGKNPAEDITTLYDFIKVLDPDSVVRGSELDLVGNIPSLMARGALLMQRVLKNDVIRDKEVMDLKKEILRIEKIARKDYETRMNPWRRQAVSRGVGDRINEFDPYGQQIKIQNWADQYTGGDFALAQKKLRESGKIE